MGNKYSEVKGIAVLVDVLKDLVREEYRTKDTTAICQVAEANEDGTYNLYVLPDTTNAIKNIPTITPYALSEGQFCYIYKIQNNLNNCFIIKKAGLVTEKQKFLTREQFDVLIEQINSNPASSGGGVPADIMQKLANINLEIDLDTGDLIFYNYNREPKRIPLSNYFATVADLDRLIPFTGENEPVVDKITWFEVEKRED